jgi:hypothetical protein
VACTGFDARRFRTLVGVGMEIEGRNIEIEEGSVSVSGQVTGTDLIED